VALFVMFICAAGASITLLAEHVALWSVQRHLHQAARYTVGTVTLGIWFTIWCIVIGFQLAAVAFWVIAAIGGATVITCYWVRAVASDSDGLAFWAGSVYQEAERTYGQANNGAERATGEY
jgi:hypothetical protein